MDKFSVAVSIGSATVMSCYLLCIFAHRQGLLQKHSSDLELQRELGLRLMKALILHATSDPLSDPDQKMLQSLGEKRAAAQRTQPSPFQRW